METEFVSLELNPAQREAQCNTIIINIMSQLASLLASMTGCPSDLQPVTLVDAPQTCILSNRHQGATPLVANVI